MTREALQSAFEQLQREYAATTSREHLNDLDDVMGKIRAALTALDTEFDPTKHLSGWVKHRSDIQDYWKCGSFTMYIRHDGEWHIAKTVGISNTVYRGPIKTASFFLALCGALNIK